MRMQLFMVENSFDVKIKGDSLRRINGLKAEK